LLGVRNANQDHASQTAYLELQLIPITITQLPLLLQY
jgi:hypothetical protein